MESGIGGEARQAVGEASKFRNCYLKDHKEKRVLAIQLLMDSGGEG